MSAGRLGLLEDVSRSPGLFGDQPFGYPCPCLIKAGDGRVSVPLEHPVMLYLQNEALCVASMLLPGYLSDLFVHIRSDYLIV